jgi:hypothetical protein
MQRMPFIVCTKDKKWLVFYKEQLEMKKQQKAKKEQK